MKDNFGYDMECIIEHLRGIDKRNRDIVFKKDIILIEKHNFNFDHDIEYECIRATQECIGNKDNRSSEKKRNLHKTNF